MWSGGGFSSKTCPKNRHGMKNKKYVCLTFINV
jgi:hypothetical protein